MIVGIELINAIMEEYKFCINHSVYIVLFFKYSELFISYLTMKMYLIFLKMKLVNRHSLNNKKYYVATCRNAFWVMNIFL